MTDERLGLPSASSRARDSRCPGARNLITALRLLGKLEERTHAWTESGTRIHEAVAGGGVDLSHDEEVSRETVDARLAKLRRELGVPDDALEIVEDRFWLWDGLRKIASGQPDKVWVYNNTAVIPDIKTGWGETEAEESNLQFRAYAVLINRSCDSPFERVIVATINAHGPLPKPVEYGPEDLERAEAEWREEIAASNKPGAPRVAGNIQCKYCPAKLHCPEAQALVPQTAALTIHAPGIVVTNDELGALLDRCSAAEKVIGEIRAEAKRRLAEDPEALPGWRLTEGRTTSKIIDLPTVFARCNAKGVSAEAFTAACSIYKTNLTAALQSALGIKGKALNAVVSEVLEGATESKTSAPILERAKAS